MHGMQGLSCDACARAVFSWSYRGLDGRIHVGYDVKSATLSTS